MRPLTAGLGSLVLQALCAVGCGVSPPLRAGDPAPAFNLPTLDGGELSSRALAGEPVILNFWATWCQPCRREIPVLKEMAANPEVRVVGVALDEEGARAVRPFVDEQAMDYTILLGNQEVFQRYSGFSIPYTLVLDRSWTVVNVHRGPVQREELLADLARIAGTAATQGS